MEPLWQFFKSVKLTVVLLLTLAGTSIIGTLIPQNETPAAYFQAFGPFFSRLFHVLDFFDMYHSWWFQGMLVLLTANIVVCSIDRLSATWKLVFVKSPVFNRERFKNAAARQAFSDGRSPAELAGPCLKRMAASFATTRFDETEDGFCLFGERWRWSRLGVYAVHSSVVLLLVGGLTGSMFGFEGMANIAEGESVQTIRLRNSNQTRELDFAIRCDDFDVSFYESGAPKEFRSELSIIEQGKVVFKKAIIVNDPLRYKGINIYQASYGTLPPRGAMLVFTSKETGMRYRKSARIGDTVEIPEGQGSFSLDRFDRNAMFKGHAVGEAFGGTLTTIDGQAADILLPQHFPSFDRMRGGSVVVSVENTEQGYYTGLQVSRDPGVWVVYAGFVLMLAGCFVTFFMSHQQVCMEVVRDRSGSRVTLSGRANKNPMGMERKVEQLVRRLGGPGNTPPADA
ncbi:MAG: cytochrome c biogenesis protein ResB [Desulfobacterales bacterium]|nr:cytochrome c biogenesis protein ResB [Desulfobacterales bacterium]